VIKKVYPNVNGVVSAKNKAQLITTLTTKLIRKPDLFGKIFVFIIKKYYLIFYFLSSFLRYQGLIKEISLLTIYHSCDDKFVSKMTLMLL